MTELVVLDFSAGSVDFYSFDMELNSEEIEDFLFNSKHYKESEIQWMFAPKLSINKYRDSY